MRPFVCVALLVNSLALAQEIGTEITPVTPESGVKPKAEQAPANTEPPKQETDRSTSGWGSSSTSSRNSSSKKKEKEAKTAVPREGMVSAGAGSFGIRAGFSGNTLPAAPMGNVAPAIGSVGLSIWATDGFTLLFDAGFGMAIAGSFALGFSGVVGMDYHFGTVTDALRPLFNLQAGVTTGLGSDPIQSMALVAQVAGGAEYFFSPSFSVSGRVGLGFRFGFTSAAIVLATLTPGVGAAWYF